MRVLIAVNGHSGVLFIIFYYLQHIVFEERKMSHAVFEEQKSVTRYRVPISSTKIKCYIMINVNRQPINVQLFQCLTDSLSRRLIALNHCPSLRNNVQARGPI